MHASLMNPDDLSPPSFCAWQIIESGLLSSSEFPRGSQMGGSSENSDINGLCMGWPLPVGPETMQLCAVLRMDNFAQIPSSIFAEKLHIVHIPTFYNVSCWTINCANCIVLHRMDNFARISGKPCCSGGFVYITKHCFCSQYQVCNLAIKFHPHHHCAYGFRKLICFGRGQQGSHRERVIQWNPHICGHCLYSALWF